MKLFIDPRNLKKNRTHFTARTYSLLDMLVCSVNKVFTGIWLTNSY